MALSTQVKVLRALREILLGNGTNIFPPGTDSKPPFPGGKGGQKLPRCSPEEVGLESAALANFYRDVAATKHANVHSLFILRYGKVVAEGDFAPFRSDLWHVTHSLCKSLTGTAVGLAINEGLFSLEDPIAQYFPQARGLITQRRYAAITVRHLLTMSSGLMYNEISEAVDQEWLKGIFSAGTAFEAGSKFVYNSMNSYLLSVLVTLTSGQGLVEYLAPRIFEPMGFGPLAWEKSPEGYEKGGWGMYMMPEDMAKLGQLYLQKGHWQVNGEMRQLIPESWAQQAVQTQITGEDGEEYGYHFWTDSTDGSFTMNGMFGQYVTVLPRLDMVIAMTAGNPQLSVDSGAYALIKKYFFTLPAQPGPLNQNPIAFKQLHHTLDSLRFRRPCATAASFPKRIPAHTTKERWNLLQKEYSEHLVTPYVDAFCDITWRFKRNRGGFLPIVIQGMDNNFSSGVKTLRIEHRLRQHWLFWEEGAETFAIQLGLNGPLEQKMLVGGEEFRVAVEAKIKYTEEEQAVLMIEVCFLELSSCRLLKLFLQDGRLLLHMDEEPQFSVAIETMIDQQNATNESAGSDPLASLFRDNEFLHYRISQLCTPNLVGIPIE